MTDLTSGTANALGQSIALHQQPRHDQPSQTSRAGLNYTPPVRTGAFKAAGRHTARVRFLRRAIILGAVFGVSIIAIVVAFDPFKHLPRGVSMAGVGVKGTKITMDSPKLTGVQQGGGRYRIEAKTGIQDILTPSVIELLGVDSDIGMADHTTTHVLASHGVYDNKLDTMSLDGNVKIANTSGYTFGLKKMMVDFKRGTLTSEERMRVDLKGGNVRADGMTISNNGHNITFKGHIESTFDAPGDAPPASTVQASTVQASTVPASTVQAVADVAEEAQR